MDGINPMNEYNCTLNNVSYTNCSAACLQPSIVFSSSQAMNDCFFNLWWTSIVSFAGSCGIPWDTSDPSYSYGSALTDLWNGCFQQYCQAPDPNLGGCPFTNLTMGTECLNPQGLDMTDFVGMIRQMGLCTNVVKTVNPDIGGAGVFVSYLMQIFLLLTAWFLLNIFGPWRWPRWVFKLLHSVIPGKRKQQRQAQYSVGRLERFLKQQPTILKSILVEFQEAQCFFMLASQAAVLNALHRGQVNFSATNNAQLQNNYTLVGLVGLVGMIPITLCLFILFQNSMASWYILAVSGVTLVTSIVTSVNINNILNTSLVYSFLPPPAAVADLVPIAGLELLEQCGFNPPPIIFCNSDSAFILPTFAMPSVWFCFSIYCLLFLGTVLNAARGKGGIWDSEIWLVKLANFRARLGTSRLKKYLNMTLMSICIQSITIGITLILVSDLVSLNTAGGIAMGNWTLGQVVAVAIWTPVICKYMYSSIFGLEEYSHIRIAKPYAITHTEPHS